MGHDADRSKAPLAVIVARFWRGSWSVCLYFQDAMGRYSHEPVNQTKSCKARGSNLRVHFKVNMRLRGSITSKATCSTRECLCTDSINCLSYIIEYPWDCACYQKYGPAEGAEVPEERYRAQRVCSFPQVQRWCRQVCSSQTVWHHTRYVILFSM